jgi:hypothetical protein
MILLLEFEDRERLFLFWLPIGFAQESAPVASGGAALPNGWNLLFGEAIRVKFAPRESWSQQKY